MHIKTLTFDCFFCICREVALSPLPMNGKVREVKIDPEEDSGNDSSEADIFGSDDEDDTAQRAYPCFEDAMNSPPFSQVSDAWGIQSEWSGLTQ
jgi:hypothetical protein